MGDYEDARRRLLHAEMACWQPAEATTPAQRIRARWIIAGILAVVAIAAFFFHL